MTKEDYASVKSKPQAEKSGSISLTDHLKREHGEQITRVTKALPNEMRVLEKMQAPLTIKDALLQSLVVEISEDYNSLGEFFDIEGDPLTYYKEELMETPQLDKAREEFDRILVKDAKSNYKNATEDLSILEPQELLTSKLTFQGLVKIAA